MEEQNVLALSWIREAVEESVWLCSEVTGVSQWRDPLERISPSSLLFWLKMCLKTIDTA